ncbi:hypothetical protein [Glycomyces artemisiae]|uniref:hypothetical protein n=1 Tax=Glycomyces artemisiae TaxID=1076443 RepID=UPI0015E6B71C|nr:hypothetical protein [Glycomyces artemisiae]
MLAITADGRALLKSCNGFAADIDVDLTSDLDPADAEVLRRALAVMSGFPASAEL